MAKQACSRPWAPAGPLRAGVPSRRRCRVWTPRTPSRDPATLPALGSPLRFGPGTPARPGTWRRAEPAASPGQSGRCQGTTPSRAASCGLGSLGCLRRRSRRARPVSDTSSEASLPPPADPSSAEPRASPQPSGPPRACVPRGRGIWPKAQAHAEDGAGPVAWKTRKKFDGII